MCWSRMVDAAFQALSAEDKRHALRVAQGLSGRRAHLLENRCLGRTGAERSVRCALRRGPRVQGRHISGQGLQMLRRFSEDVDITCDIRPFAPELAADAGEEAPEGEAT